MNYPSNYYKNKALLIIRYQLELAIQMNTYLNLLLREMTCIFKQYKVL